MHCYHFDQHPEIKLDVFILLLSYFFLPRGNFSPTVIDCWIEIKWLWHNFKAMPLKKEKYLLRIQYINWWANAILIIYVKMDPNTMWCTMQCVTSATFNLINVQINWNVPGVCCHPQAQWITWEKQRNQDGCSCRGVHDGLTETPLPLRCIPRYFFIYLSLSRSLI